MKNSCEIGPSRGGQGLSGPELRRGRISFRERLRQWLSDGSNLFFALLIVIHLIPVWSFKYFPSSDGPAHLNNANVLREYHRPDRPVFREYYVLNKNFDPNVLGHLVLAGLMYLLPTLMAEKVFLTSYVILLPISIRYVLRMIRPEAGFLAVLAFPFVYNFLFHMGFYNFSYSLVMFFFTIGYWLQYHERFTLRETIVLTTLALGLYSCHIISLIAAYVMVALFTAWLISFDLAQQISGRRFNFRALWIGLRTRALAPLCAFLPTFILAAIFLLEKGTVNTSASPVVGRAEHLYHYAASRMERLYHILVSRAERLYHLDSLISYDEREGVFSTALVWLFIAVLVYLLVLQVARRRASRWDGLLLVVAGYIVMYFTALDHQFVISHRMNLYPFFVLILWFGAWRYQRSVQWGIQVVAAGIALALLGLHMQKYAELNDYLEEFLAGSHLIESNTTLLPLIFSPQGHAPDGRALSSPVLIFEHASGHIAAQRGIVDLQNYEAGKSYFPVRYRPHLNPYTYIVDVRGQSPQPDFLSYPQRTGGRVDYVLVWRTREVSGDDPVTKTERRFYQFYQQFEQSIFRQLEEGYELIYTSPQRGFMQLYRRKDWKHERASLAP
jgi:hypothetical protein